MEMGTVLAIVMATVDGDGDGDVMVMATLTMIVSRHRDRFIPARNKPHVTCRDAGAI